MGSDQSDMDGEQMGRAGGIYPISHIFNGIHFRQSFSDIGPLILWHGGRYYMLQPNSDSATITKPVVVEHC